MKYSTIICRRSTPQSLLSPFTVPSRDASRAYITAQSRGPPYNTWFWSFWKLQNVLSYIVKIGQMYERYFVKPCRHISKQVIKPFDHLSSKYFDSWINPPSYDYSKENINCQWRLTHQSPFFLIFLSSTFLLIFIFRHNFRINHSSWWKSSKNIKMWTKVKKTSYKMAKIPAARNFFVISEFFNLGHNFFFCFLNSSHRDIRLIQNT